MAYSGEELNFHIIRLHQTIYRETVKATAGLFYLLQGIEDVRQNPSLPILPDLKIYPILPEEDVSYLFSNEGIIQTAFKGWVCQVYNGIWEYHRYRFKELFGGNAIDPETDFMGDFRRVRNAFFKARRASKDLCRNCKVVKWFKPGDPIVFKLNHVLEFLHQLSHLSYNTWLLKDDISPEDYDPSHRRLISIRTTAGPDGEHGETRHMLSCVFDDGVFGCGPIQIGMSNEEFQQAIINEEGDVDFPQGEKIMKRDLYYLCLDTLRRGPHPGPGMYSPPYRIQSETGARALTT